LLASWNFAARHVGAIGFSPSTIARLKNAWAEEHGRWSKRDLSDSS
jgi:hypothetical protein